MPSCCLATGRCVLAFPSCLFRCFRCLISSTPCNAFQTLWPSSGSLRPVLPYCTLLNPDSLDLLVDQHALFVHIFGAGVLLYNNVLVHEGRVLAPPARSTHKQRMAKLCLWTLHLLLLLLAPHFTQHDTAVGQPCHGSTSGMHSGVYNGKSMLEGITAAAAAPGLCC